MTTLTTRTATNPSTTWWLLLTAVLAAAGADAAALLVTTISQSTTDPAALVTSAPLLAGVLAAHTALAHAARTGRHRPLRWTLTALVTWYSGCAAALACTGLLQTDIADVPATAFAALLAATACWTTRTTGRQFGGRQLGGD
jgi:hypothetical protein